jgi:hypothetical protein
LVLTRGASVITQFFRRVKIEILPKWSGRIGDSNASRHFVLSFFIENNGKDTVTNLRAEIFAGLYVPNSQIFQVTRLKIKPENSDELKDEVTLPYRVNAEVPSVLEFFLTQTDEGLKYGYRAGSALGTFHTKTRICDISLYLYAEGGYDKSYKAWLIGTGDANEPFLLQKRGWRYR